MPRVEFPARKQWILIRSSLVPATTRGEFLILGICWSRSVGLGQMFNFGPPFGRKKCDWQSGHNHLGRNIFCWALWGIYKSSHKNIHLTPWVERGWATAAGHPFAFPRTFGRLSFGEFTLHLNKSVLGGSYQSLNLSCRCPPRPTPAFQTIILGGIPGGVHTEKPLTLRWWPENVFPVFSEMHRFCPEKKVMHKVLRSNFSTPLVLL